MREPSSLFAVHKAWTSDDLTRDAASHLRWSRSGTAESQLHCWCGRASRSRLEPFRTLAKTVRQHWEGILAYFNTGLTSAAIEAVNGIIQLAKRMARGFKNLIYFRTAAYLGAGRLKFELPVIN